MVIIELFWGALTFYIIKLFLFNLNLEIQYSNDKNTLETNALNLLTL